MAKFIPKINPADISNSGERAIAEALAEQLSNDVTVIHSFNWARPNDRGVIVEGECDFVLLDRNQGMLFLEVKGGTIRYKPETDQWLRVHPNGDLCEINRDPVEQVRTNMYAILKHIKTNLNYDSVPFTYGYAVAFPNGRFDGPYPANLNPDQVLDGWSLKDIKKSLARAFKAQLHSREPKRISRSELHKIEHALFPRYQVTPVLFRTIEDEERLLHRLTEEQKRILDVLSDHKLAKIEGVAGSGKTILALAKAQEMARSGKRTLLVCYNKFLKEWLMQKSSDDFGAMLALNTYHGLVHNLCKITGTPFEPNDGDKEFWTIKAPDLLMDVCDKLSEDHKFDAVIVDEGQDFRDLWWDSLEFIFRIPDAKECYYVFYDPNQNLYTDGDHIPAEFKDRNFPLKTNCRNTVNIASHCASIVEADLKSRSDAPQGAEPEITWVDTIVQGFDLIGKRVRSMCTSPKGGLKMSQICVLTPGFSKSDWPKDFKSVPVTQDIEAWRANKGVLIASLYQFKGLESDVAIVLTKPLSSNDSRTKAENYVARSRARHLLVVVEVNELSKT